jgi:peptidyl-prolyl cis-trans isomerase A (cyclophilin A)
MSLEIGDCSWTSIAFVGCLSLMVSVAAGCESDGPSQETQAKAEATQKSEDNADNTANEKGSQTKTTESENEKSADTEIDEALLNPEEADKEAPKTFTAKFKTSKGAFDVKFRREWAPNGVDRVYNLIEVGYFEDVAFFRVIDGFMAQFGLHGEPKVNEAWADAPIEDDPVEKSNTRGMVTFAQKKSPNSRTTQMFINFTDNSTLDKQGFAPVGKVEGEGMTVVDKIYAGYGESRLRGGKGPPQGKVKSKGNDFLKKNFPKMDYIESVEIVSTAGE